MSSAGGREGICGYAGIRVLPAEWYGNKSSEELGFVPGAVSARTSQSRANVRQEVQQGGLQVL